MWSTPAASSRTSDTCSSLYARTAPTQHRFRIRHRYFRSGLAWMGSGGPFRPQFSALVSRPYLGIVRLDCWPWLKENDHFPCAVCSTKWAECFMPKHAGNQAPRIPPQAACEGAESTLVSLWRIRDLCWVRAKSIPALSKRGYRRSWLTVREAGKPSHDMANGTAASKNYRPSTELGHTHRN